MSRQPNDKNVARWKEPLQNVRKSAYVNLLKIQQRSEIRKKLVLGMFFYKPAHEREPN